MQNSVVGQGSRCHFSSPFILSSPLPHHRVHARENVIKRFLSFEESPFRCMPMILKGRNCSWKLHLDSFLLPPWRVSNSCSITCTSCCADCKNRMWKFMEGERRMMEMMMYDWKWYDCFFSSFLRDSKDSFDIEKNPLKILFLSLQANCNNLCRFNIL